ncbi:acyltransferase family protein [Staphylococcus schleiferi subsp. coagulans]|uniref:acyltransferase family protein n=1 Tax=Staphylococcus coagulans TaxID=74706 RepID=UPI0015FBA99F|nr:acyltransferase family protein [Staphylococcus coagulans]MBA8759392.1 acyltransferase family protein [Staphylococcus coagulans]MBA8767828.1 acyltransferase family protein [Staphylococcus coagulans]
MTTVKKRDAFFDNARAGLIFLVVLGHLIRPYVDTHIAINALYLLIYSFHMPAFLFISGYFANNVGKSGYIEKVGKKLLGPYLIFFAFFSIYYFITGKNSELDLDPFEPVFALWFLLTLFFFNVIIVIVRQFKPKYVLPIAIIVSLLAGFSSNVGDYLSWSRTLVFFPIFYVGYLLNIEFSHFVKMKRFIPISILVLVGFFVIYIVHPIDADWLLASTPYKHVDGMHLLMSPLKRLSLYGIIFVTMFSFFNLVPRHHHWYTYIGSRTMYVYLLHGLFIGVIRGHQFYPFIDTPILGLLYNIVLSCFIVWLWSSDFVAKWTNPMINLQRPSKFKPYF